MPLSEELNKRFGIEHVLRFEELPGGLTVGHVTNDLGTATIAVQGAHVMNYQPQGQSPLIWLSGYAKFAPGKSIRGGAPICWPWFGPHATESAFPGHGYARTVPWELLGARQMPDGRTELLFEIIQTDATRAQWPYASRARHYITVGREIELRLITSNTGDQPFALSQALHTYFTVGDIRQVSLRGLGGTEYIDKMDGGARKRQDGPVVFTGETDRIYLDTAGYVEIHDPALKRSIIVTATGSRSTVVWNPWIDKAEKMGDFGPEGYKGMVCVETANAADDTLMLHAGQEHVMAAQYRILPA